MNLSQLLLFEEFEIHSTLSAEEIIRRIRENTDTDTSFYQSFFRPPSKKYVGKVGTDSFTIWRRTTVGNFFRPLIKGKLYVEGDIVKFRLKLHMSSLNLILLLPFVGFATMLTIAIADYGQATLFILPVLLILPLYLWAIFSLKAESANVKFFLSDLMSEG